MPKSPKRKGKGKGKKGKSPKPRHKKADKTDAQTQPENEPKQLLRAPAAAPLPAGSTWMQAAQQIIPSAPAAPAATAAPSTPSSVIPAEFKSLIESLRRNQTKGTLPEDVQQEMKSIQVKEEKVKDKEMLQAVKTLNKARRDLRQAHDGRSQLHTQWRSFLALSVTQWQEFTQQFQNQEAAAIRAIGDAQTALEEAKAHFEETKATADIPSTGETTGGPVDVDILSDEEPGKADTSATKLQDGLRNLTNSLQELSAAAENIHAEEQVAKKARLEGHDDVSGTPGARQMEPFALPGTKRPQGAGA